MKRKQCVVTLVLLAFLFIIATAIACCVLNGSKVKIELNGAYLSVNHSLGAENYTVVWECDAGSLSLTDADSVYQASTKNSYYLYAGVNERVKWSPADQDGFTYTTATIKVSVFKYSGDDRYNRSDDKIYTDLITVSSQNGEIIKSKARAFGNPIRENSSEDWSQILVWDQQGNYVTLRYRYGKPLERSQTIGWSTNVISLSEAIFYSAPVYVCGAPNSEQYLFDATTVCYDFSRYNSFYFDGTDPDTYPGEIKITAFIVDKKTISEDHLELCSAPVELSIKWFEGEGYYTID